MGLGAGWATALRAALRSSEMWMPQWSRLGLRAGRELGGKLYQAAVGWRKGARCMAASGQVIPSLSGLGRD